MHSRQDHTVKDRQSLDCGQPGTAPQATNVCQCSQPRDQRECGAGAPEDQLTHKNTHTCTCFAHILQSLLLYCSVSASLTATATQTILPMREQLPQEGCRQETLNAPNLQTNASDQSRLILSQRPQELLNWKCT